MGLWIWHDELTTYTYFNYILFSPPTNRKVLKIHRSTENRVFFFCFFLKKQLPEDRVNGGGVGEVTCHHAVCRECWLTPWQNLDISVTRDLKAPGTRKGRLHMLGGNGRSRCKSEYDWIWNPKFPPTLCIATTSLSDKEAREAPVCGRLEGERRVTAMRGPDRNDQLTSSLGFKNPFSKMSSGSMDNSSFQDWGRESPS